MILTLLISVSGILIPNGNLRKIADFTGGLILLAALARFYTGDLNFNFPDYGNYQDYQDEITRRQAELTARNELELEIQTAKGVAEWIEHQARESGAIIRAEVDMKSRNGVLIPWEARLYGERDENLSIQIARELDIPESRQIWITAAP